MMQHIRLLKTVYQSARQYMRGGAPALGLISLCCALAACSLNLLDERTAARAPSPVSGAVQSSDLPTAAPAGPIPVALILPLSTKDNPSIIGQSLRFAAEMAASEAGDVIKLSVKDDHSSFEGARVATQAALSEGNKLIIGPLYSTNVREVGRVARAQSVPVIGFSTDTATANAGVYLLSFLAESYVDRILNYAVARGKKSIGALIPDTDYGRVAEAEFQVQASRLGVRIPMLEHYSAGKAQQAIVRMAQVSGQMDALFIPEQAELMPPIAHALGANAVNFKQVQILGTGLWNDPRVLSIPSMQNAWFAAPDYQGFADFAARYRARYGSDPLRIASLAYDAVTLASALARANPTSPFTEAQLTAPTGFTGLDGLFRFRPDGQNERGLAIFTINNGMAVAIEAAPTQFAPSTQ
jgi:branched-chain amino acid transport system substrate-binding protein